MAYPNVATSAPAYGSLQVGGYVFSNFAETGYSLNPNKSMDGRTVTSSDIVVTFKSVIGAGAALAGLEVAFATPRLQKAGVGIVYRGRGVDRLLGALGVNVRDIAWGPMPGTLKITPRGGVPANAYNVEFTITAKVPTCPTARFSGLMDVAVGITYAVDYAGLLTRTYSGRLKIANNLRSDGMGGTDSPDLYYEFVIPDMIPGFYRHFGPRRISEDKTELSWEIRDEELPNVNIPPAWVVGEPVLSQRVSSIPGTIGASKKWVTTFNGKYELSKDCPNDGWAAEHFFQFFVSPRWFRLAQILRRKKVPSVPLATSWEFVEPNALGRRTAEFSISFIFITDSDTVFNESQLFTRLSDDPAGDWVTWVKSLSTSAFNPTGVSNASFNISNDTTVTGLCSPSPIASAGDIELRNFDDASTFDMQGWADNILRSITPQVSWLDYHNTYTVLPRSGVVTLQTLPKRPLPDQDGNLGQGVGRVLGGAMNSALGALGGLVGGQPDPNQINPGSQKPLFGNYESYQQRTPDSFRIVMEGYAIRANYPIPPPMPALICGVKPTPVWDNDRDYWVHDQMTNLGGVPTFGAAWRFTFLIDGPVKRPLEPAPNPLLGNG